MTYTVAGTQVIESDAKINWNKLTGTPSYWTSVAADEIDGGTWAGLGSGKKYEIENIGSNQLGLKYYIDISNCNCVCDCNCGGE